MNHYQHGPPQGYGPPPQHYAATQMHYAPIPAPYGFDPVSGKPWSSKSKVTAGLLQFFLGGFGAGRFYTGHVGLAIAQVLCLWIGTLLFVIPGVIAAIWIFIDSLVLIFGNPRDAAGLPMR